MTITFADVAILGFGVLVSLVVSIALLGCVAHLRSRVAALELAGTGQAFHATPSRPVSQPGITNPGRIGPPRNE